MDFPPDWEIFPEDEFTMASPRNAGELGMELLAQVRPNGRVLDHYRITMGGSKILDITVPLEKLLLCQPDNSLLFKYQVWPKDISIKRNMSTSSWSDVYDLLASRCASVAVVGGEALPHEAILADLKGAEKAASIRFATVIGEDLRMRLVLQCLPASTAHIMGKPLLRG